MSADQPLTGDELATIKARAEAATPGPWETHLGADWLVLGPAGDVELPDPEGEADAEHIAGMDPATTLRLVAEIERLQAQVERVDALAETWRCNCTPSKWEGHEDYCDGGYGGELRAALDGP